MHPVFAAQPKAMQNLVPFLVLQSSHWGRESWLLCSVLLPWGVSALCLFLMVPCVGLWCVIVKTFPVHTHLLLEIYK